MIITPHIVTGMVIGKELGNPFLVSVLALSSHFVLDIIPHWQENRYPWTLTKKTYIRIFLDIVVSIFIISMVKSKIGLNPNIILGIFFSILPDLSDLLLLKKKPIKNKLFNKIYEWHKDIQNETPKMYGVVTQLVVVVLSLIIIF